ncbi:uncharacterized protein EV420DRAFT_1578125 [Desarmillaria tabescens]|uniref:Uncharacterized protein n=1 Tax=Armillaria tabescens TaxID=1929756 RepID=A0AA39MN56_ARMTA|nr:uncharacterized protein EV420DRAFT_1581603 [Desarmillaria tabescens]XP_060324289.1 uncharacterized protein EV420DRAFT_1578125 [Desarmillaria tabescens]KAK0440447.1 hypothetical protein EV420DRAFT_1581603 [Desarmillaria tabescens]KAK0442471.1 hypothetical protein EV420DRAFT_1578125 [Desarmillaria tabescens]
MLYLVPRVRGFEPLPLTLAVSSMQILCMAAVISPERAISAHVEVAHADTALFFRHSTFEDHVRLEGLTGSDSSGTFNRQKS